MLFKDKFKKFLKGLLKTFVILIITLLIGFGFYNSSLITEGRNNQLTDLINNIYISSNLEFRLEIKNEDTISYKYIDKVDGNKITIFESKKFRYSEGTFFLENYVINDEGIEELKEERIVCLGLNRIKFLKFNKTLYLTS